MNVTNTFDGQQSGERILVALRPHRLSLVSAIFKTLGAALLVLIVTLILDYSDILDPSIVNTVGLLTAFVILIAGIGTAVMGLPKNVAYITDRRLVKFQATSPFAISTRNLRWQDVVKIKTFSPNFIWKIFNVGTVIAHSHSTLVNNVETNSHSVMSDDDIDLPHIYYFQDLGNYLDKILYLYHHEPASLTQLKPFVFKPRGKRD